MVLKDYGKPAVYMAFCKNPLTGRDEYSSTTMQNSLAKFQWPEQFIHSLISSCYLKIFPLAFWISWRKPWIDNILFLKITFLIQNVLNEMHIFNWLKSVIQSQLVVDKLTMAKT